MNRHRYCVLHLSVLLRVVLSLHIRSGPRTTTPFPRIGLHFLIRVPASLVFAAQGRSCILLSGGPLFLVRFLYNPSPRRTRQTPFATALSRTSLSSALVAAFNKARDASHFVPAPTTRAQRKGSFRTPLAVGRRTAPSK